MQAVITWLKSSRQWNNPKLKEIANSKPVLAYLWALIALATALIVTSYMKLEVAEILSSYVLMFAAMIAGFFGGLLVADYKLKS